MHTFILFVVSAVVVIPSVSVAASTIKFSDEFSDVCGSDSRSLCSSVDFRAGYAMLDCMQAAASEAGLSPACMTGLNAEEARLANLGQYFDLQVCGSTLARLCNGKSSSPQAAVKCLVQNEKQIGDQACRQRVFAYLQKVSQVVAFDPWVRESCSADVALHCSEIQDEEGLVHQCLMENLGMLSATCKEVEFRLKIREQEDLRLNPILLRACASELSSFCKFTKKTGGAALACLHTHRKNAGMTTQCQEHLFADEKVAFRNIEFLPAINRNCLTEIRMMCDGATEETSLPCLKSHLAEVSAHCRQSLIPVLQAQAEDLALDPEQRQDCAGDLKKYCSSTAAGAHKSRDEQLACLDQHYEELSPLCKERRKSAIQLRHADPAFATDLRRACGIEISKHCATEVEAGNGLATMACILAQADDPQTSSDCRDAIVIMQREAHSNGDIIPGLAHDCAGVLAAKCKSTATVDGVEIPQQQDVSSESVDLDCLRKLFRDRDHEMMADGACANRMQELALESANDINVDIGAAEACENDIATLCPNVKYGQGRVHACLRSHLKRLTPACYREEFAEIQQEAGDARLMPGLRRACSHDLSLHCASSKQSGQSDLGCLLGAGSALTQDCAVAVLSAQKIAAGDVRLDTDLFHTCRSQIPKLCGDVLAFAIVEKSFNDAADTRDGESTNGGIVDCLIQNRAQLSQSSPQCAQKVIETMQFRYEHIDLDPTLSAACHDDRVVWCASADPNTPGAIQECLQRHLDSLSQDCRRAEFAVLKVLSEDVQLDQQLMSQCAVEIAAGGACDRTKLDGDGVTQCLEQLLVDGSMASMHHGCADTVRNKLKAKIEHAALNRILVLKCAEDASFLNCGDFDQAGGNPPTSPEGGSETPARSSVFECLANHQTKIKSEACKTAVAFQIRAQASDIRLDSAVSEACKGDLAQFCSGVSSEGVGELQQCLRDHFSTLSKACFEAEFTATMRAVMTFDIRAQPALVAACREHIGTSCQSYRSSEVLTCLVGLPKTVMTDQCAASVKKHETMVAKFDALDPELHRACHAEMPQLCAAVAESSPLKRPEGAMVDCLVGKFDRIGRGPCKDEVFRIMQIRAQDTDLDPLLATACSGDIDTFCQSVPRSDGLVHECLRDHFDELAEDECRVAEQREMQLETRSVLLKAQLYARCASDLDKFCASSLSMRFGSSSSSAAAASSSDAGESRGGTKASSLQCLQIHRFDPGMSPACLTAVTKDMIHSSKLAGLMPWLTHECKADVSRFCAHDQELDQGLAAWGRNSNAVLSCLTGIGVLPQIQDPACRAKVESYVQEEAADVRLNPAISAACETDMRTHCTQVDPGHGKMHECLREKIDVLRDACRRAEFSQLVAERSVTGQALKTLKLVCYAEMGRFCPAGAGSDFATAMECLRELFGRGANFTRGLPVGVGDRCAHMVRLNQRIAQLDLRLAGSMATDCGADVALHCQRELARHGGGVVGVDHPRSAVAAGSSSKEVAAKAQVVRFGPDDDDDDANVELGACLMTHLPEIGNARCAWAVQDQAQHQLAVPSDMPGFSQACQLDVKALCTTAEPPNKAGTPSCLAQLKAAALSQASSTRRANGNGPKTLLRSGLSMGKAGGAEPGVSERCATFLRDQLPIREHAAATLLLFASSAPGSGSGNNVQLRNGRGGLQAAHFVREVAGVRVPGAALQEKKAPNGAGDESVLELLLASHANAMMLGKGDGDGEDSSSSFLVLSGKVAVVALGAFLGILILAVGVVVMMVRKSQSGVTVNKVG